jgi:hypothetical protein
MCITEKVGQPHMIDVLEQEEEPTLPELEIEIECPRCNNIMELNSKFGSLVYSCDRFFA